MRKVVFLDRDGTINVDNGFVYKWEDWQWTSGAIKGLKALQEAGFTLAIVTNQSGIAHGLYTKADADALHDKMKKELAANGVHLDYVAFCPDHRDSNSPCRKPNTGMATEIEQAVGAIDYQSSWTIGDKEADLLFGKNLGTHTALIRSKYWSEDELTKKPDLVVDSLADAAQNIV